MTIKPVATNSPKTSSEDSSEGDGSISPTNRSPFHRGASSQQEADAHPRVEPDRNMRKRRAKLRSRRQSPGTSQAPATSSRRRSADASGYNSSDEREPHGPAFSKEKEEHFVESLKSERGFLIRKMQEDGACLFRAVADQVYGDEEFHSIVRANCLDYMQKNVDFFSQYVTEDFTEYITRKREETCFGNNIEIQAMSELYNRSIEVYQYQSTPINTFQSVYHVQTTPIRISYHFNIHYNSVLDPSNPSVGLGLGMAGLDVGLADRSLMSDAYKASEKEAIEKAILDTQMQASEWEVTAKDFDEHVRQISYLEYLQEAEKKRKRRRSSPRLSPSHGGEDEEYDSQQYSPRKRSSPPNSPSVQTLQNMQKHQLALLRLRKENMHLASSRTRRSPPPTIPLPMARSNAVPSSSVGLRSAATTLTASSGSPSLPVSTAVSRPCTIAAPTSTATSAAMSSALSLSSCLSSASSHSQATSATTAAATRTASLSSASSLLTANMSGQPQAGSGASSTAAAATAMPVATASSSGLSPPAAVAASGSSSSASTVAAGSYLTQGDAMMAAELAAADLLQGAAGIENLDEASILASVLAASQQEYFDEMKKYMPDTDS